MLRLTTAKYYTPSGRLIQKPYDEGIEEYHKEILKRYEHGEFINKDSISFPDSLRYETLVKKRIVFGGGGIMPDIFIPLDTTIYTDYEREIIRNGILNQFILQYVDKNRKKLKSTYRNIEEFKNKFTVSDELLHQLDMYSIEVGLKTKPDDESIPKGHLRLLCKAYIARDMFSISEFYEILNLNDPNVLKALEVLKNWEQYYNKVFN